MSHDDMSTGPIDVGAVRRDDQFVDDLAAGRAAAVNDRAEYELAGLIAQWRAESLAGPVPSSPTVAEIETAIARTNERARRGGLSRRLRIVSGAAAVMAVAAAGLLVLSEGSQPGDPLWSVKQVVFADQAQETQARLDAQESITEARKALEAGDTVKASELIAKAEAKLGPIQDKREKDVLADLIAQLRKQDLRKLIPSLPALPTKPAPTVADTGGSQAPTGTPEPPASTSTTKPTTPSSTVEPSTTKSEPAPTTEPTTSTSVPLSASVSITVPSSSLVR
ncbi:MAG: anti-sigma-D factor RsdA [Gordonia sp. (in: high G+C Gram-positive bacteria)]|uniref:anti-sigma-D factor RsdA n=1 Tax=Gordonia sp. (in: high G+C Gram-positive bacteria) TaxID=84139 RepID=UPI003C716CF3